MALEEIIELLVRVQDTVGVELEEMAMNCCVLGWRRRREEGSWLRRRRWGGAGSAGGASPSAAVPVVLGHSSYVAAGPVNPQPAARAAVRPLSSNVAATNATWVSRARVWTLPR